MTGHADTAALAADLRQAAVRLVRRLRTATEIPLPQGMVMSHLDRLERASIGELASIEGVRPQSMAQTVGELERLGYVMRNPDPHDGRKVQLTLTADGRTAVGRNRRILDDWLSGALQTQLDDAERAAVAIALPALQRIADS